MAEKVEVVSQQFLKPIKLLKWKVSEGYFVSVGTILLIYDFETNTKEEHRKLKATRAGSVHKLLVKEGAIIHPGDSILELISCIHPTVIKDMCAECGADLRKEEIDSTASVPMIHAVPDLKVTKELAQKIGKADEERLLQDKKLVLLVDLDQTIIHTTNDIIPPNIKDVYHFQLYGPHSPWYHTRLRPGTQQFLKNISAYFELHICTFGARNYAHKITQLLDPDGRFFSNRVLSRDECFDPTSKTANLSSLFPCGDHMVCIIDDREDVWSYATNLIHVKPYHFFKHTGDINAPPGLDKHEDDDKVGVDLDKIVPKDQSNNTEDVDEDNKQTNESKYEGDVEETENEVSENKDKDELENVVTQSEDVAEETGKEVDENNEKDELESVVTQSEEPQVIEDFEKNKKNEEGDNEKIVNGISNKNDDLISTETLENYEDLYGSGKVTSDNEEIQSENIQNFIQSSDPNLEDHTKSALNSSLNLIEIDDPDDYLLYLEDILKNIHFTFYEQYDKMECGNVPDLKKIIPEVKSAVLRGTKLCFSGLVPTHLKLEQSKAYQIARSLGAEVMQHLADETTHLVAVRRGTAKVNAGRRKKDLYIVTPDWLWACAERWERAPEKLFPLSNRGSKNRHPPPHCSSPEHVADYNVHGTPAARKRTDSGRFMDTINPLMSFSTDDIADMDKEVEDVLEEDLGVSNELSFKEKNGSESSSSSDESMTAELPLGHHRFSSEVKKRRRRRKGVENNDPEIKEDSSETSTDSDAPRVKFRKGDADQYDEDNVSEESMDAPDELDDGEWNMMGAALEREFLSNN